MFFNNVNKNKHHLQSQETSEGSPKRPQKKTLLCLASCMFALGFGSRSKPKVLFGDGYHPTIVFFKGFLGLHRDRGFDPQPFMFDIEASEYVQPGLGLCHSHVQRRGPVKKRARYLKMTSRPKQKKSIRSCWTSFG